MKFEPLRNNVVVVLEPEAERQGSLIVKPELDSRVRYARILRSGPDCMGRHAKVGQRILASIAAGVELPGSQEMLIQETAILAYAD